MVPVNILVIDDERVICEGCRLAFSDTGHQVTTHMTGRAGLGALLDGQFDVVLLDMKLPDMDGMDLLRTLRKEKPDVYVIVMTGYSTVQNAVEAMKLGAFDYLAKPFSLLELSSRMQAIIRRKHGLKKTVMDVHGFQVDINNRAVAHKDKMISLTKKEFDILQYLLINKNRVITRVQLTEHIWDNALEADYDSNYVDVHIKNLRKKLSQHEDIDWIETVRGIGYRLNLL